MIKRFLTISGFLLVFAISVPAQEMKHEHHHDTHNTCMMCCCQIDMSKCNHLCHTMPMTPRVKVLAPKAISDDLVSNAWLQQFLDTMNGEISKSGIWENTACIEMCSMAKSPEKKKVDFKNIILITISCELPGIETFGTITNPGEIKAVVSSLKRKNLYRLGRREHISIPNSRVKLEDKSGNSVTFFLVFANQAFASDMQTKKVYWLTSAARKIVVKYCR